MEDRPGKDREPRRVSARALTLRARIATAPLLLATLALGAIASAQSSVLTSRDELEERYQQLLQEYKGKDVPRPDTWGGYVLKPHTYEFWQGRPSRLHDRIRYRKDGEFWHVDRLSP